MVGTICYDHCCCQRLSGRKDDPIVRQVNEAFEAVFGFDAKSVIGQSLDECIVPEQDTDRSQSIIQRNLAGDTVTEEVVRHTAGGEERHFLFKSAPLSREDGTIEAVASYVDITDRRERIKKLEKIKQNVTEVIWMSGPENDSIDFISDSYQNVWGRSPESLRDNPKSFLEAVHPEDRNRVEAALEEQTDRPDEYEETYRVIQPDGEIRWVHDRSSGVYQDDTLTRIVGIASDITERRERERKLKSRNRAMEEAPIGIIIHDKVDSEWSITYANSGFRELTGYEYDSVVDKEMSVLSGTDTNSDRLATLATAFDQGEAVSQVLLLYRQDGTPFWGRVSIAPVTDEASEPTRYVAFLQNVTDSKEHAKEIERRLDEFGEVLSEELQTGCERSAPVSDGKRVIRTDQGCRTVATAR
jgi:PAS domain S-box-containing protein